MNAEPKDEKSTFMHDWYAVRAFVRDRFEKRPDINAFLFLIGLNELNSTKTEYSKEEKQDLMHIGLCKLFEEDSYFIFEKYDADGWPHFKRGEKIPPLNLRDQEDMIKQRIVRYFKKKKYIA